MINILDLTSSDDIEKVREFSSLAHPPEFRYFKNRRFEDAISSHIVTIMYSTYGYAHIDNDEKTGRNYLGVCVLPEYQGRGVGKALIKTLLKLYTGPVYLTVDKENARAIKLYESFNFKKIETHDMYFTYARIPPLSLEVSVGEALDKLSILDIKLEKIRNIEKREQCELERNTVLPSLTPYLATTDRFYTWLKYINRQIWDLQDIMRDRGCYTNENFNKILDLNDMRFRVKQRINSQFQTSFQEQKGYVSRTGIFLTHTGLGDIINMNGAIRYAALMVDKLYLICKQQNAKNVREMFADDTSIHIVECENNESDVHQTLNQYSSSRKFISGCWCGRAVFDNIPNVFYEDLQFPYEIKHIFAYIHSNTTLEPPSVPYIFTHSSSSSGNFLPFETRWDINVTLTIDPTRNYYANDHPWYSLAQQYVQHPIFSYKKVIENAKEVHVTDSSFYCLSCFLNIKSTQKACYDRTTGHVIQRYSFI